MRRIAWLVAVAVVAAGAPPAAADPAGAIAVRGNVGYAGSEGSDTITAGLEARVLVSGRWALGLDVRLGGATDGFVYRVLLFPVGFGVRLGRTVDLGILAGAGLSGVTGAVDVGVPAVVEVFAESELGGPWRVGAVARVGLVLGAEARDVSLGSSPLDEVFAGVSIRAGKRSDEYNGYAARGWRLAAGWQRAADGHAVLVTLGYAVDIGWLRTPATFPRP